MIEKKPTIWLLCHYPGSYQYFEALIPHLEASYQVNFLFTPKVKPIYLKEMEKNCQKKNYSFYSIKKINLPVFFQKIPLLCDPIIFSLDYKWKSRKFLKNNQVDKIIASSDTNFYHNYLMRKAKQKKAETFVLQWSFIFEREITRKEKLKLKPYRPPNFKSYIKQKLTNLLMGRGNDFKTLGGGASDKIGVINQRTKNSFIKEGINHDKISVVGFLDFSQIEKAQKELTNPEIKQKIAKEYSINLGKTNIAVFSHPFNIKDVGDLSDEEQLAFFEKIIQSIRKVFPQETADILFKIHPAENINLYKPLEKYGVKIFNKESSNGVIVYFSNLYISHFSTTNLIPMMMQKPCIFLNIFTLAGAEQKLGQIFTPTHQELVEKLRAFQANQLPLQYRDDPTLFTKNSLEKILAWIN